MPLQAAKLQSARARFTSLQQTEPPETVSDLYGRQSGKYVLMVSEITASSSLHSGEVEASQREGPTKVEMWHRVL